MIIFMLQPSSRDLIVTSRSVLLINMESPPGRGRDAPLEPIIKRNIPFPNISHVILSTLQVNIVLTQKKSKITPVYMKSMVRHVQTLLLASDLKIDDCCVSGWFHHNLRKRRFRQFTGDHLQNWIFERTCEKVQSPNCTASHNNIFK